MPDVFIPIDTAGVTTYLSEVNNRGLIYRFAFRYADENRQALNRFGDYHAIKKYLDDQDLLHDFVDFARDHGVKPVTEDIIISDHIIVTQLEAYIARNIIDNAGFYPIIHTIDKTLQKGVAVLSSGDMAAR